jgi:hypothetical protein
MHHIPTADVFVGKGMDRPAILFGYDKKEEVILIWLPNTDYTFKSGTSTLKLQYEFTE